MHVNEVWRSLRYLVLLSSLVVAFAASFPEHSPAQSVGIGTRMALIIGNSNYSSDKLPNAQNDAKSIAATLQTLDFDVTLLLDATRGNFLSEAEAFAKETVKRNASVVLVYYAGHGVQVAGKNYLIPIDASVRDIDSLVSESVHFDQLLKLVGSSDAFKMIFLDACQNNPFSDRIKNLEVGLAAPPDVSGFLIGYATQPGKAALDGAGDNSPYATALLSHMHSAGEEILSVLANVNQHVRKDTGGAQVPYVQFSFKPEFYFKPGPRSEGDLEVRLWKLSVQQEDPDLIELYLQRYPEGRFVDEAQILLKRNVPGSDSNSQNVLVRLESLEEEIWSNALASRSRSLLHYYIERFPEGRYLEQAEKLVTQMISENPDNLTPAQLCRKFATHPNDSTVIYRGVSLNLLAKNAGAAVNSCQQAVRSFPEDPHYKALLARSHAAAGDTEIAVDLYRQAATAGNTRALVSLGLLHELGQGLPKDLRKARELFEQAYDHGSPDGAINLAVSLYNGTGGPRDVQRAITLLEYASSEGAARATFNLGVFAKEGIYRTPEDAADFFELAARQGYAEGALAAAAIYDEGFHTDTSPQKASELLLSALTADSGETLAKVTAEAGSWSRATIIEIQTRLKSAGYYDGALDGVPGPLFNRGLETWRLYGGTPS